MLKGESKEAALEILKIIMNKSDEIKDISGLNFCRVYVKSMWIYKKNIY